VIEYSQYTFAPSPLINVDMDLVMTFKVTISNIEKGKGGGGVKNAFKFSYFLKRAFSDGIQFF